ncbi:MAG: MgtC/SapB family protein [Burkholderiales bacterium]|nr:MgtC/SapB family protein [Burkholderiales bacterium]
MDLTPDVITVRDFAIALLIGALVGIDREKRKREEGHTSIGGLRTFVLMAGIGALTAWLSVEIDAPWIFIAGLLCVSAGVGLGYLVHARAHPDSIGLTTEMAAIVVFLLGGTVLFGYTAIAVGLAIATSAVLAYKQPLHGLVARIGREDMFAVLRLLIATFIVLPLLPDRTIDPWEALNPYKLWLLVILIAGLSLVGYVAARWIGSDRGAAVTGLTGGLVSSTAVTLTFARQSRGADAAGDALACGILIAWAVMFLRVIIEVLVVHAPLLRTLWMPFLVMAGAAGVAAGWFYLRSRRRRDGPDGRAKDDGVPLSNPFSLTSAAKFAAFFAVVLMLVSLAQRYYADRGLLLVAALAGLTDVDAITLSMADHARGGGEATTAARAIVVASLTNTVVKAGMVAVFAGPRLRLRILSATALILAVGVAALILI